MDTPGILTKAKDEEGLVLMKNTFTALIGKVHHGFYLVEYTQSVLK
jgi:hypothetical protein